MLTEKRMILTIAAVIAASMMAGGVGIVELARHQSAVQPVRAVPSVVQSVPFTAHYVDDAGGGDR